VTVVPGRAVASGCFALSGRPVGEGGVTVEKDVPDEAVIAAVDQ
jgi:hypothetical protein